MRVRGAHTPIRAAEGACWSYVHAVPPWGWTRRCLLGRRPNLLGHVPSELRATAVRIWRKRRSWRMRVAYLGI